MKQPTTEPIRSPLTPKDEEGHSADKAFDVEVERAAFEAFVIRKAELEEDDYRIAFKRNKLTDTMYGNSDIQGLWDVWQARAGLSSHPKEQAEPTLPEMPKSLYRHPKLGEMFDRLQMHFYAVKHADAMTNILIAASSHPIQPAPAEPKQTKLDIDREGAKFWHRNCSHHLSGIMKESKREPNQSLITCMRCGKSGYYPVGGAGCITTTEVSTTEPT